MTDFGIEWEENTGFIHPAQDFYHSKLKGKTGSESEVELVAITSQSFRVKEETDKGVLKEVERSFAITSTRELIPLKRGTTISGKLLTSLPTGFGGDRWSRSNIRAFLDGKVSFGEKPSQVSFFNVYAKIKGQLKTFMELEEEEYSFLALWVMHTYFAQMFGSSPILYLNAVKGSGKSKLLQILSYMAFNALYCVEPSDASIFRIAHHDKATILIDELERIRDDDKSVLRIFLNGRYKRGMVVTRVEPGKDKTMRVRRFDLFGSTALANISGLDTVLEDRCVTLILKRALSPLLANSEPEASEPMWQEIRDDLYGLMLNIDFLDPLSANPECYDSFKLVRFYLDFWDGRMSRVMERVSFLEPWQKQNLVFLKDLKVAITDHTDHLKGAVTDHTDHIDITDSNRSMPLEAQNTDHTDIPYVPPGVANVGNVGKRGLETAPHVRVGIVANVGNVGKLGKEWLVGRTLQLWKPILIMAACVDSSAMQETPQGAMKAMIGFAEHLTKIKAMDDATENPDVIVVEDIVKAFQGDKYYSLKVLCEKLKEDLEWIKPQILGRALKRLGFDTKRKMKSVEYLLTEAKLKAIALRLRVDYDALILEGVEERREVEAKLEDGRIEGLERFRAPKPTLALEEKADG